MLHTFLLPHIPLFGRDRWRTARRLGWFWFWVGWWDRMDGFGIWFRQQHRCIFPYMLFLYARAIPSPWRISAFFPLPCATSCACHSAAINNITCIAALLCLRASALWFVSAVYRTHAPHTCLCLAPRRCLSLPRARAFLTADVPTRSFFTCGTLCPAHTLGVWPPPSPPAWQRAPISLLLPYQRPFLVYPLTA